MIIDNVVVLATLTNAAPNLQFPNAGYYTPVQPPNTENNNSFVNNGFTSFMGANLPFNMQVNVYPIAYKD